MRVAFASSNEHKLRELRACLPDWELELLDVDVDETGATFLENARLKARAGRTAAPPDVWALGEDSGLEVDGLGGRPGVCSARYAGPGEDPLAKLLAELGPAAGAARRARYVCELVLVAPDGREVRGRGTLEGAIGREARGREGFGYDPLLVPDGEAATVAELGNDWKRAHSHRARAAASLLRNLE